MFMGDLAAPRDGHRGHRLHDLGGARIAGAAGSPTPFERSGYVAGRMEQTWRARGTVPLRTVAVGGRRARLGAGDLSAALRLCPSRHFDEGVNAWRRGPVRIWLQESGTRASSAAADARQNVRV